MPPRRQETACPCIRPPCSTHARARPPSHDPMPPPPIPLRDPGRPLRRCHHQERHAPSDRYGGVYLIPMLTRAVKHQIRSAGRRGAAPCSGVQALPCPPRPGGAGRAGGARDLRQLHPQDPGDPPLAATPSSVPSALHPTYSSWLNLVERWFAELASKWLRRGTYRSVGELTASIQSWIDTWNQHPRPFVWTKTADQILDSITRYLRPISQSGH
jgi:hypothetical protein